MLKLQIYKIFIRFFHNSLHKKAFIKDLCLQSNLFFFKLFRNNEAIFTKYGTAYEFKW